VYVKVYVNENLNTLPTRENVHMYVKDFLLYQRLCVK